MTHKIVGWGQGNYLDDSFVLRTAISAASSGANELVAAVAGKKIKVVSCLLVAAGAVTATFRSGATPNLSGAVSLAADGDSFVLPAAPPGYHWFETAEGAALNLVLNGAVAVAGCLVYYTE